MYARHHIVPLVWIFFVSIMHGITFRTTNVFPLTPRRDSLNANSLLQRDKRSLGECTEINGIDCTCSQCALHKLCGCCNTLTHVAQHPLSRLCVRSHQVCRHRFDNKPVRWMPVVTNCNSTRKISSNDTRILHSNLGVSQRLSVPVWLPMLAPKDCYLQL